MAEIGKNRKPYSDRTKTVPPSILEVCESSRAPRLSKLTCVSPRLTDALARAILSVATAMNFLVSCFTDWMVVRLSILDELLSPMRDENLPAIILPYLP